MGTAETFDHTADVGLRIGASDLDDLFQTAAGAVFDYIVTNRDEVRIAEREPISLTADDPASLLVDWLNELIFRCETKHRLYAQFDVHIADDGRRLEGAIGGEPIDRERHILDHEVKAVTRHGLTLAHEGDGWRAEMILDI